MSNGEQSKVRTRFAPSPTGFLHVGGVRTALFAWLVAKQHGGQFILRIEDTDQAREVVGSEQHIMDSLGWLGLKWDEGLGKDEASGLYRQSERREIYRQWGQKLVDMGRAYADIYSVDQLDELRTKAKQEKRPFLFREHRPKNPPKWDGITPLRFKSEPKVYTWHDEVMGELSTGPEAVDDFILIKSDGYPTYNFAHIVDDHLMAITHVIRSQEFLASVPKFLNLYEALNIERPKLATLPYVMGQDGRKKLSKRDGAKDILDYKKQGFLPEALISFLVTLGWNDGTTQEVYTIDELLQKFSLDRVQKSGAKFDEQRLVWVNGHFIRELSTDELYRESKNFWGPKAQNADTKLKARVLEVTKDRLKKLSDLSDFTTFFFKPAKNIDETAEEIKELFRVFKGTPEDPSPQQWLNSVINLIKSSEVKIPESLEQPLKDLVGSTSAQPKILFGSLRAALTGADQTPPIWYIVYALGKEASIKRLKDAIEALEK